MEATAGEIVDQRAERLGIRRPDAQNSDLVSNRDSPTCLPHTVAGPVIWTIGIVFPCTGIAIEPVVRGGHVG